MTNKRFCNCLAWQKGLDPVGYATPIQRLLAVEVALPWHRNALESLPPALRPIVERAKEMKQNALSALGLSNLLLIAPEQREQVSDCRRALVWERPASSPFARFTRREYILPEEVLTDFGWAMTFNPELLPQFDRYQVNKGHPVRDFLVCTHGTRDAACGKFGYQLYSKLTELRAVDPYLRVWRTSHIGGHIFAPTSIELPTGVFWGNLYDDTIVEAVVQRRSEVGQIRQHYRGWSGVSPGFAQVAEREMLIRQGWPWLNTARTVEVTAQDPAEQPQWAEVRIVFNEKNGNPCVYAARVEVSHHIETIASTETLANKGQVSPRPYPQYQVTHLERQQLEWQDDRMGQYEIV